MRELATLLENEGIEAVISTPHCNFSVSILLAVSEQEAEVAEGTYGPNMQYTETTDLYRKADHQYFKDTKFRFKTRSSKRHLHSQVLRYSDLQKCLWKAHPSSNIMEQRKKWYLPKLEVSKVHYLYACASAGSMHTPKALRLKLFCPAANTKVHVLCRVHKWWRVLATHFLLTAERENIRGLDGEQRKMQDRVSIKHLKHFAPSLELLFQFSVHAFMCICCCKTSTTASNSPTGRPRWITTWTILPTTMLLYISPLKVTSPSVGVCMQVQPSAWKRSRIRAKLSGQYWALFTVRKFNTSKTNSSFDSPRPVKQVYLRIPLALYFMTAERMRTCIKFA